MKARRRLLDLVVEVLMISFAVMLALAAEEWRESRERESPPASEG